MYTDSVLRIVYPPPRKNPRYATAQSNTVLF